MSPQWAGVELAKCLVLDLLYAFCVQLNSSTTSTDLETQVADLPDPDPIQPYSQDSNAIKRKMAPSRISDVRSSSETVSCACEHEVSDKQCRILLF